MKIFGIINITPDSFSDGKMHEPEHYAEAAKKMLQDGAFAIDVGAESTRPGAIPITQEEEWQRLKPVLAELGKFSLSIDTRNPRTVRRVLDYHNVKYINDVTGLDNPEMLELARLSHVNVIVMHSLIVPADKKLILAGSPVETIQKWIKTKFEILTKAGIKPNKIIFDPGIGFGKSPEQSQELITRAADLAKTCHSLGTEILYGHSRKSFLGGDVAARDIETAKISADLQKAGVDYIRVHNIEINKREISN